MHAENLILDFKKNPSTVIKAAIAYQEVTMPFVPYFSPFLSIYATEPCLSRSFNDEDNESNQGYSDEDQPMSPELYDSDEPPTPTAEHQPNQLTAYNDDPYGGFGLPSNWSTGLPIPLSEITPNTKP
jgi:hypothetical protein